MSQSELLKNVVAALNRSGTPYMLTGSWVSTLQGIPRSTHDVDFVVAITEAGVDELAATFRAPDYYLDAIAATRAVQIKGQFNLIDTESGFKVDFWPLTDDEFNQMRFSRRIAARIWDEDIFVSRPEDTILMKLRWAAMSGGSERQMNDARGVLQLQGDTLDVEYIEAWAERLEVTDLWREINSP